VFTRVTLFAQVQSVNTAEAYTYRWVLINKPASSQLKNNSIVSINNNQGLPASFVPDFEGVYVFELTAYDGCNPPVSRVLTVSTACTSTLALLPLQVSPRFLDQAGRALPAGSKFTFSGGVAGNGLSRSTKWSFAERTCANYYVPTARPPPAAAAVANSLCSKVFKCKWDIEDEPCGDGRSNPLYQNRSSYTETVSGTFNSVAYSQDVRVPGFPEINRNPSGSDECTATFKCRHPGVYKMKLTVSDECTTIADVVTITCRCSNTVKAIAATASRGQSTDRTVYYQCQGNNNYDFTSLALRGSRTLTPVQYTNVTASMNTVNGNMYAAGVDTAVPGVVQTCPSIPVVPTDCSLYQKCCPAKECCPPACPTCPTCPACPACPTSRTGGAELPDGLDGAGSSVASTTADGPVPAAHSAAARSAFAQSKRSTQQSDAAFGIVAPLSAILVVSVIGNLVLPSMAKKLRAAEESA
jgi:hypothetical protein